MMSVFSEYTVVVYSIQYGQLGASVQGDGGKAAEHHEGGLNTQIIWMKWTMSFMEKPAAAFLLLLQHCDNNICCSCSEKTRSVGI